jgi:hypothetical protein
MVRRDLVLDEAPDRVAERFMVLVEQGALEHGVPFGYGSRASIGVD